ncbi:GntR family transcriptional regulator [Arthrobacter sp.]|uniref:GntR family transcriptional regulator n=1 Tax=Arthrobacter sp. TaxID=1667 RepID=UPI0033933FAE
MNFEAVTRKEAVLRQLRHEIQTGELLPGAQMIEVELAARLGVSVTPVREAVAELISEGLVQGEPNKRKRVTVLKQRDAVELTDCQGILLVAALRRTAAHVTAENLRDLAGLLGAFAARLRSGDQDGARKSFEQFAEACLKIAKQQELAAQLRVMMNRSIYRLGMYPLQELTETWAVGAEQTARILQDSGVKAAADRLEDLFGAVVAALYAERPLDAPVPLPSSALPQAHLAPLGAAAGEGLEDRE